MKQLCFWLTVIGGLNWGLVGLFNWNLVEALSFGMTWLPTIVYIIVGLSAICCATEAINSRMKS